jgi:hypothetical protein
MQSLAAFALAAELVPAGQACCEALPATAKLPAVVGMQVLSPVAPMEAE